jgi:hypothetical protein
MVFSSGAPTSARAQGFLHRPEIVFLDKPISGDALKQFVADRQLRRMPSIPPSRRPDERT